MQSIESTKENKERQKQSTFYSSSSAFLCLVDNKKDIDTKISFLNHFLIKRDIKVVSLRLTIRKSNGDLIKEKIEIINKPKVYYYSVSQLLKENGFESGVFSAFLEFTSKENLAVPFCAVVASIQSKETIDHVHTYGRALETKEINTKIDFKESYETGWTISSGNKSFNNYAVLHNGRLPSKITLGIYLYKKGILIHTKELEQKHLSPFETLILHLEEFLDKDSKGNEILKDIQNSEFGMIEAKLNIKGLSATFPRLLYLATERDLSKSPYNILNFRKINITHSNFDFDKAEQPKSSLNYGFINSPEYPQNIINGFRYYCCSDLKDVKIIQEKATPLPFKLSPLTSIKVSSNNNIPTRLVGAHWYKWNQSNLYKETSTGTFVKENSREDGFWHWGLLSTDGSEFDSIISLINPFATNEQDNKLKIKLFGEYGYICSEDIQFKGKSFSVKFNHDSHQIPKGFIWYTLTGNKCGSFHVFCCHYFPDLKDGTMEHGF